MKYLTLTLLTTFLLGCNEELIQENQNDGLATSSFEEHTLEPEEVGTGDISSSELVEEQVIVYDDISLPTLAEETIEGSDLKLEQVLSQTSNYTRYRISYKNGEISLSGIMNIPFGEGPFPLLVLNHGYIDTRYYTNGRGLKREQNYFANNGFAVIHPDYRNHAFSDKIDTEPYDFRLGYTRDVIAAVYAVQNSKLPELSTIDSKKVGMLGHSMGSGISQNIAVSKPDTIDAMVLYGPVSNDEYNNFEKFQLSNATRSSRVQQVLSDHGSREENEKFWDGVSSQTFFEKIKIPVKIFTGTADKDTPTEWAQDIAQDLKDNGKSVDIIVYEGEGHEFGPQWSDFMQRSNDFFKEHLQ